MNPGKYNLPDIRRGDTWASRAIATITDSDGVAIELTSARMQIRNKDTDSIIHQWSTGAGTITLSGTTVNNIVTLDAISNTDSASFTVGNQHKYDLEVTTASGNVWTVLEGKVNIIEDVSYT